MLKKGVDKPLLMWYNDYRKRGNHKWLKRTQRKLTADVSRKRERNCNSISTSASVALWLKIREVKALIIAKSSRGAMNKFLLTNLQKYAIIKKKRKEMMKL
jgi:hypothetical protein